MPPPQSVVPPSAGSTAPPQSGHMKPETTFGIVFAIGESHSYYQGFADWRDCDSLTQVMFIILIVGFRIVAGWGHGTCKTAARAGKVATVERQDSDYGIGTMVSVSKTDSTETLVGENGEPPVGLPQVPPQVHFWARRWNFKLWNRQSGITIFMVRAYLVFLAYGNWSDHVSADILIECNARQGCFVF